MAQVTTGHSALARQRDWDLLLMADLLSYRRMIHPTAIVHPRARLHSSVEVGPYAIVDEAVEIGADCVIGPYVHLTGVTQIGGENRFHTGCVIGDPPQDLKYKGEPTRLVIGDRNVFREHVTVHRSNKIAGKTVVGSDSFLMQHCHIAHDCTVGNQVILAGGALLAGHVTVQDRAFISGNCLVHQFITVGMLAIMQGGSAISKDLPPFCVAAGINTICGLNTVGLRRAGLTTTERQELKAAYRVLFRSGLNRAAAIARARKDCPGSAARALIEFVAASKRGVCADASLPAAADATGETG
jgi:UDP-N-acetylglucosamine acyltransferase